MPPCSASSFNIFSSPEPKAPGELIVWDSSQRPYVRSFTLSNKNLSETSWPIMFKFHLEHHWGGGLTTLGFGLDRIRTLVSIAKDSSHRVIMGKSCDRSSSLFFIVSSLFLQATRTTIKSRMGSKFGRIRPRT